MIDNLMAMFIFAAGVTGTLGMVNHMIRANREGYEITAATTLARNVFEDLRRRDPEEYLSTGMPSGEIGPLTAGGELSASGRYYVSWDYVSNIPHTGLNSVQISVWWLDADNKRQELTLMGAIRAPRTKPRGAITAWSGYTPEMYSYTCACAGGCEANSGWGTDTETGGGSETSTGSKTGAGSGSGNGNSGETKKGDST